MRPLVHAEVAEEPPELFEEVAFGLFDPEELRHLADDDRQREADDESLEYGLRNEAREEPEPDQTGEERQHADRRPEAIVSSR